VSEQTLIIHVSTSTQPAALLQGMQIWLELGLISADPLDVKVRAANESLAAHSDLSLSLALSSAVFLEGLHLWLDQGWLDQARFQVSVIVSADHPALLTGLDQWLQAGLLSDQEIKQLCRDRLSQRLVLPEPAKLTSPPETATVTEQPVRPRQPIRPPESSPPQPAPGRLAQMVQSLMAELSVLWLLLLGVFMVVISSGVLAASQWERFPAAGQYGILWLYTLAFGAAGFWAGGRPNLRLTAQALWIVTLLLLPVNFLAMDGFGLWRTPLGWFVGAIAALSLSALAVLIFQARSAGPTARFRLSHSLLNYLGLSYLQWGWVLPGWPLLATYLGVIGTTTLTLARPQGSGPPTPTSQRPSIHLNGVLLVYAIAMLLLRALFTHQVELPQMGLAVGLCGWLLAQQANQAIASDTVVEGRSWERLGGVLIGLGWLLSVATIAWQALVVSGLAVWILGHRLVRTWARLELAALLLIGLQMLWLVWRIVPDPVQRTLIATTTQLTGAEQTPWALLSVVLLPYLVLILAIADGLMQIRQRSLATFAGWTALLFGAYLTVLGLVNPLLRTVNLAASTLAWGVVTERQQQRNLGDSGNLQLAPEALRFLVGFCHTGALLALTSAIDWQRPQLGLVPWAGIGLGLMVLEWIGSRLPLSDSEESGGSLWHLLRRDSWGFGLVLAGLTYGLLFLNQLATWTQATQLFGHPVADPAWGAVWLITPIALTGLVATQQSHREWASWLSVAALGLAQLLTLAGANTRLLGLGLATGLMLINTHRLRHQLAAGITVGFGLALAIAGLGRALPGLSLAQWLLAGEIAATGLWLLRHGLSRSQREWGSLYQFAADGWASGLTGLILLLLCWWSLLFSFPALPLPATVASLLLMAATTYRSWQPARRPWIGWLSIAVLLLAQLPNLSTSSSRLLALGLATLLMPIQTRWLQSLAAAHISVGFGLALVAALLWQGLPGWPPLLPTGWLLAGAMLTGLLWLTWFWLSRQDKPLAHLYRQATDHWAVVLCGVELAGLTLHSLLVYWRSQSASVVAIGAAALILAAIAGRSWTQPSNWALYGIGWSLELVTLELIGFTSRSIITLAIANIGLGLFTQVVGDWWHRQGGRHRDMLNGWHVLPLLYGGLGTVLQANSLTSWTGWSTLGLALIGIGVGRRRADFKPLLYLSVAGISVAAYQLLAYQIADQSQGDQFLAMAALATSLVYAYRILTPWLAPYLRLTRQELKWIAHFHWALGSALLLIALLYPVVTNKLVGLGAGLFLTRYAIAQGRRHPDLATGETWVYLGLLEATGLVTYATLTVPVLTELAQLMRPWSGAIAAIAAALFYQLPWQRWGWSPRPYRVAASLAPLVAVGLSLPPHPVSLLVIAGFYGWLAWLWQQFRWLYLSLGLVDWAIADQLRQWNHLTPFASACVIGISILLIPLLEPSLQPLEARGWRHFLRLLGSGIMCGTALLWHHQTGILPGIVSLIATLAGLALRTRAFLYVGTIFFLTNAFYQMVILSFTHPLIKWIVGLLIGICFIWIAASFETRREQLTSLVRNWLTELAEWE